MDEPNAEPAAPVACGAEPPALRELKGLVAKAKRGDVTVLPRIREILDHHAEVWQHLGDVDRLVTRAWAERLGGDAFSTEVIKRKAEQLRSELEGDSPT